MFQASYIVNWGDCDAAGIIFYPKYFYWFDSTFNGWLRARGLSQRQIESRFGGVTPLVDVGATFRSPVTYDDEVVVEARLVDRQEKRFRIGYRVTFGDRLVAEGHEERAWATRVEGRLRGALVPSAFFDALTDSGQL